MRINWHYSEETEIQRIVFTASSIARNIYSKIYYILPYRPGHSPTKFVYFPRYTYRTIPGFWHTVTNTIYTIPLVPPPSSINPLAELVQNHTSLTPADIKGVRRRWEKVEKNVFSLLRDYFPRFSSLVKEIEIRPTLFGSYASYSILRNKKIYLYYRVDAPISTITEMIVTSVVHGLLLPESTNEVGMLTSGLWQSKELTVDFLFKHTRLAHFFPQHIETITHKHLTGLSKYAKDHYEYLNSLGLLFDYEDRKIDPSHIACNCHFTPKERKMYLYLMAHINKICTFDELGDVLYESNPDRFSLAALAKLIQGIRKKLLISGQHHHMIQTHRGQGYGIWDFD